MLCIFCEYLFKKEKFYIDEINIKISDSETLPGHVAVKKLNK